MGRNRKKTRALVTVLILAASFFLGRAAAALLSDGGTGEQAQMESGAEQESEKVQKEEKTLETNGEKQKNATIVVDAGHGGIDAGKVGVNNALEKEVNLQIAQKLKALLEKEGYTVVMTREDDGGLYDEGEENKKQQDMKRRCALINDAGALLAVSIHQNSYTQESVCGPQVFYYETSAEGKTLAQDLQDSLNEMLEIARPRDVRANATYYILRKTSVPTVIVECGFLSNREEARKLTEEDYQEEVAQAIAAGIAVYVDRNRILG